MTTQTRVLTALGLLAALPLLLTALLLAYPSLVRGPIAALVGWSTGLELRIDGPLELEVSATPLLTARDLTLRNPAHPDQPPLARVGRLDLRLDLEALLRGRLRLPLLALSDADIHLQRDAGGRGNWQSGKGGSRGDDSAPPAITQVSLARIRIDYRQPGAAPIETLVETLSARIDPDLGVRASLSMTVDGNPYHLETTSGAPVDGAFPLQATLTGEAVGLDLHGRLGWPLHGTAATELELRLKGDDLTRAAALLTLPLPPLGAFDLQTRISADQGRLRLAPLRLQLEHSTLEGTLALERTTTPPRIEARLALDRIEEGLLQRLLNWPPHGNDGGPAERPPVDARFDLSLGQLAWRGTRFRDIRLEGTLDDGRLQAKLGVRSGPSATLKGNLSLILDGDHLPYRLELEGRDLRLPALSALLRPGKRHRLEGHVGRANASLTGTLRPGPAGAGIDRLDATLEDATLELLVGERHRIPLRLQRGNAHADRKQPRLAGTVHGRVGDTPMTLTYRLGPLVQLASGKEQPLELALQAEPTGLLEATLQGGFRLDQGGLAYHGRLQATSDDLARAGAPFRVRLPAAGPVRLDGELEGSRKGLRWRDASAHLEGGVLSGDGELVYRPLDYRMQLRLEAPDGRIIRRLLGFAGIARQPLEADLAISGTRDRVRIEIPRLATGDSRLAGTGEIRFDDAGARFDGSLRAERLQLADFVVPESAGKPPTPAPRPAVPERLIPATPIDTRWLQGTRVTLTVDIRHLLQEQDDLGAYRVDTRIADGTLTASARIASRYLPEIALSASISNHGDASEVHIETDLKQLDYGALFRIFDVSDRIQGRLDLKARFRGRGRNLRDLLAGGDGELVISGGEGRLDFEALRLWGGSPLELLLPSFLAGEKAGQLECLAARYHLRPGLFASDGIVLNLKQVLISGSIRLTLPEETLSGTFQPEPKGARLWTMDTPITIAGTLARPTVSPATADTLLSLGKLAVGISNPAYLVILFGTLGNTVENPCQAVLEGKLASASNLRRDLEKAATSPLRHLTGETGTPKADKAPAQSPHSVLTPDK